MFNPRSKIETSQPGKQVERIPSLVLLQFSRHFFSSWMLLCMDSEWSLRFIQHIPLKSSHPCSWANSKKSVLLCFAVLCDVQSRHLVNIPVKALLVALLSFASQQPSLLAVFKTCAVSTETTKELKIFFQNLASGPNDSALHLWN